MSLGERECDICFETEGKMINDVLTVKKRLIWK